MEVRWPLSSNRIRRGLVNNTFGMVRRNLNGTKRPHQGWDFYAADGTSCYAIAAGQVVFAGKSGAYGNLLVHSFPYEGETLYAAYAHMHDLSVATGQQVTKGQLIGHTGTTGNAAGMGGVDQHLHFELRTVAMPGLGLAGRMSPLEVFRQVPLDNAVIA